MVVTVKAIDGSALCFKAHKISENVSSSGVLTLFAWDENENPLGILVHYGVGGWISSRREG